MLRKQNNFIKSNLSSKHTVLPVRVGRGNHFLKKWLFLILLASSHNLFAACPAGTTVITPGAGNLTIASTDKSCITSDTDLGSSSFLIEPDGELYLDSNVKLTGAGTFRVQGKIELAAGASVTYSGSGEVGAFGNQKNALMKLGVGASFSFTGSLTQNDPSFLGFYNGFSSTIEMDNSSAFEVCGIFTQQATTYDTVVYTGNGTSNAYFINKAQVSGGVNSTLSASSNINWIAMNSISSLDEGSANLCGPNATAATCAFWPSDLSEAVTGNCHEAEGITNSLTPSAGTPLCFAMTDDAPELYSFDLDINTAPTKVTTSMLLNGEGATYRSTDDSIYTFHQPISGDTQATDLYNVGLDGTVTLVKAGFLSESAAGAEFIRYSDGTEYLMVLQHQFESKILIFDAQDLTDNTPLSTTQLLLPDGTDAMVAGLAINPATGQVLVVDDAEDSNAYPNIYSVDLNTGQLTLVITLTEPGIDAESLAFAEDGELYTESENKSLNAAYKYRIFRIDLSTGNLTAVEENIGDVISGDIEGMSCTGSKIITPVRTLLTLSATITNNNGGTMVVDDLGIITDAGALVFDAGVTSGSDKTYTATPLQISAGSYQLSAIKLANYTNTNATWECLRDGIHELVVNHSFVEGFIRASVTIAAEDSVTCSLSYDDNAVTGCSALSNDVNTGLTSNQQLKSTDRMFLGSTTLSTGAGHLKAFTIDASGIVSTSPEWDAADEMTPVEREARLFSTNADGDKVTFSSLDDAAFSTTGSPTVTTIKSTIKTASLGALSADTNPVLIDNSRDVFTYLSDSTYRSFITASQTNRANRTKRVLASSDDGFLYTFNQSDGDLGWGWMPRSLVKGLTDPDSFKGFHYMQGEIDVLDLKHSSSYSSYIVGSYKQGLGQYVLRLSNDTSSNLDSVIWDIDHSATETSVPNNGKRAYFKDGNDTSYAAYVTNGASANSSVLYIRSLTSSTTRVIPLDFNATSTAFITTDIGSTTAKSVYLGDDLGNIYAASLLDSNQALESAGNIQTDINGSAIAALNTSDSTAITYMGRSKSSTDNSFYLRAQSKERLTLFKYDTSTSSWVRKWTSYIGGSNKWSNGSSSVADAGIQALPSGAQITDNAFVVANSIALPVTEPASGQCEGLAYYYLYQLNDGHFPTNRFFSTSGSAITSTVALGKGDAKKLKFANLLGSSKMMGYGMAKQTTSGSTGVGTQIIINDPVATGVRSWKELY